MEFSAILGLTGLPVVAYLLGSMPWGLILTRMFTTIDIRKQGSGNIGATNVGRLVGTPLFLLTLAGDLLKGAFPVYLSTGLIGTIQPWHDIYISAVALSAFLGHLYPVYAKFKGGGKGVATAAGCFLVISPLACAPIILFFMLVVWISNRVSAGSLASSAALPVAVWLATRSLVITGCALFTAVFIYIRHLENIKRLLSGTEPSIRQKSKIS